MNSIGTGKNFPPKNPSFFYKAASYLFINLCIVPSINVFMNLLNRTRIIGKRNISGLKPPWILMSNHLTLLDDLFIDPLLIFPCSYLGFKYLPYHAPEERNFYKKRLVALFMKYVKSIPLIRGRGIHQEGVNRLIMAVKDGGILHIYPEGTRTRNGEIGDGKEGIGRIVYESEAPVVPLYHQGLEKVLPIGSGIPSIGKEIRIAIGAPIRFDEELKMKNDINTWRLMTNKIMDGIREQQEAANNKWGYKPIKIRTRKARN